MREIPRRGLRVLERERREGQGKREMELPSYVTETEREGLRIFKVLERERERELLYLCSLL